MEMTFRDAVLFQIMASADIETGNICKTPFTSKRQ
jgi:hypothetical protein